jgi:hypothetical protein
VSAAVKCRYLLSPSHSFVLLIRFAFRRYPFTISARRLDIVSWSMTMDGVWIGNRIYWTPKTH